MLENRTAISEFVILGFYNLYGFKIPVFIVFLIIYIVICLENLLIIALVSTSIYLESPMYYILKNMSFCELIYATNVLPRMLNGFLTDRPAISVIGCFAQLNIFGITGNTMSMLYALMSYDRYLAVSKPLRYTSLISNRICFHLIIGFWVTSFLSALIMSILTGQLEFCGPNVIDHFYCDFSPLIELSCSDTTFIKWAVTLISSLVLLFPFLFGMLSYIFIIYTIIKIPSSSGKRKAFSTCSSHLFMVIISYGSLIGVYVIPSRSKSANLSKGLSCMYIIVTPLINPIVYSLRNKEIHKALETKIYYMKQLYD